MAQRLSTGLRDHLLSGGSFKNFFTNAVIGVFTGPQPASADAAETGTLLGYVTVEGAAFTPGQPGGGLNLATASGGTIVKAVAEAWKITPQASGLPGWCRVYDNARQTGAVPAARRMDLSCGQEAGSADFILGELTAGAPVPVDLAEFSFPA